MGRLRRGIGPPQELYLYWTTQTQILLIVIYINCTCVLFIMCCVSLIVCIVLYERGVFAYYVSL
jgi:hypothetical protein